MIVPYEFTLPVSGKKITWKPLDVGTQIDLSVTYQGQQVHYLPAALYAARIVSYAEKPNCSLAEIKTWDAIDYEAFLDEVVEKEEQRALGYKKKEDPKIASMRLQKCVSDAKESILSALRELDKAVEAAKAAEASAASPLPASGS